MTDTIDHSSGKPSLAEVDAYLKAGGYPRTVEELVHRNRLLERAEDTDGLRRAQMLDDILGVGADFRSWDNMQGAIQRNPENMFSARGIERLYDDTNHRLSRLHERPEEIDAAIASRDAAIAELHAIGQVAIDAQKAYREQ